MFYGNGNENSQLSRKDGWMDGMMDKWMINN